jgi:hypothetical protein
VYDTEARVGQGQEHSRMRGNRLVDAFAAFEAGPHEMPGVASIERGARRATQLAARPTRFQDHVVREVVAREDDLASFAKHVTTQPDGMGTPPTTRPLRQEVVQVVRVRVSAERMEPGDIVLVQHGGHHDERSRHLSSVNPAQST